MVNVCVEDRNVAYGTRLIYFEWQSTPTKERKYKCQNLSVTSDSQIDIRALSSYEISWIIVSECVVKLSQLVGKVESERIYVNKQAGDHAR